MKRLLIYGSLALVIVVFLAGEIGLKWLLENPDGTRWLLRTVSQHTPVKISAQTVTGGLDASLRLEKLTARWPNGELTVADLRLSCQPLLIPFGIVAVQELSLKGVRYLNNEPPVSTGPEIVWPRISGLPTKFTGWIDRLAITDFTYQNLERPPVSFPQISAVLAWRDSHVSITRLSLATAQGVVTGTLTAGLENPSLSSSLIFEPFRPLAGCSGFELRTRLRPGRSPEQVAGEITVTARSGTSTRYTMAGTVGVTGKELNLPGITLVEKRRQGTLKASGTLSLTGRASLHLIADGLDLTPELTEKTTLTGFLDLNGDTGNYSGPFNLATSGRGWRKGSFSGNYHGNLNGVDLSGVTAALLGGSVRGGLQLDWSKGLAVAGSLKGLNLDPARLDPTWNGVVNFELDGKVALAGGSIRQGQAHARFIESRLRGKVLSGEVDAAFDNNDLHIKQMFLAGKGFDLRAAGILSQRVAISAHISDLSGLIPQSGGKLELKGWSRYAAGVPSGAVSGHGSDLTADGVRVTSVSLNAGLTDGTEHTGNIAAKLTGVTIHGLQAKSASLDGRITGGPERMAAATVELAGVTYRGMKAKSATLKGNGSMGSHRLELALRSGNAGITGMVSGGYGNGIWRGNLDSFSGHDLVGPWRLAAPTALKISSHAATITSLVLTGLPSERAELSGQLELQPLQGTAQTAWSNVNLARADQWLEDTRFTGQSSGALRVGFTSKDRLNMTGTASASGTVTLGKRTLTIQKALVDLDAGDRGTTAMLEFRTGVGISVAGRFTSRAPAMLAIPSQGELRASWEGFDAGLARHWLPQGADLQGRLSGDIFGKLLPGQNFDLNGTVTLADGRGSWRTDRKELSAAVRTAKLGWNWRGDSLSGELLLALVNRGEARGTFQLPLPARIGAALNPSGPVRGTLSGRLHEKGLITAMFPDLFQETKGELEFNLLAGGSWEKPTVTGTLGMTQAGASIPSAGIRLTDVQLDARLEEDHVRIDSFRVKSGPGSLEGSADVYLAGMKLIRYRGTLHGERFQAVHLPELQLMVAPDLTFEGNLETFSVRGLLRIPEALVNSTGTSAMINPSQDVVIMGRADAAAKLPKMLLDLQLRVLLGDRVVVKAEGLDARLEGEVNLRMTDPVSATGQGEIRVARGNYRIYGVNLNIVRGRATFTGGPIERPTLDILALREVDNIKAGVTVTGTPETPLIKLYSEPSLPDTDILSYIALGRSFMESGGQGALLMQAASMLASPGESAGLKDKFKQIVKLDSITFDSGKDSRPGYKAIEPSIGRDSLSSKETGGVSQTMLQLGKFLTPKLYVSYGRSLYTESQQFRARYAISKLWEVESRVSAEATGGDLYFRIELD